MNEEEVTYDLVEVLAELDHEIAAAVFQIQREHQDHGEDTILLLRRLRLRLKRNLGLVDDMLDGYGKTWF